MSSLAPLLRSASQDAQGSPPDPEHQDQHRKGIESDNMIVEPEGITVLAAQSRHRDRAVRFVYDALAGVVRGPLPIADWDGSDYEYIAVLARSLEDDSLPLSALVWDPATGWERKKAFAAQAVCAYMADEWRRAEASNDEDAIADAGNDHGFLRCIFRLHDRENPFFTFVESMCRY
ncbi:hypothetical protein D9619_006699 [Psilocybe cf. subviscida]|uniref:Uncharacterized protein n=1 Tax=Psilocybe cf. subviscida TaxID=2480587 RepID=A0A8H5EXQ9_9AGAR|nr:hypothetical protein D9619_006699 [Psilocybe cf. subviscida]